MRILPLAAALATFATGGAISAQAPAPAPMTAKVAKALEGRTAGRAESCVRLRDIRSTEIVDETAIIYKISRKRWLVNFPDGGCPSLRPDRVLVTRTPVGSLCRGDIARVIDPPTPIEYGACGLGDFIPYTR
ncbi:MAG: hypothetical protein JWM38_2495 [Sphingomonas bacterium]|jgi:hypothetical protein|nr:hypothetical protein [Sphingomonas bacterium]MDB5684160.1 hypothetical protein [Sphingomonas bacterium]MDB5719068.1 hypothetical protein [Sphingomonas bacterium]